LKLVAIALTFAIVVPAGVSRAAPPRESEQSKRDLEAASGLDLSRAWASYTRDEPSSSFPRYVDRRFRVRRNAGLGLAVAGGALVFASIFFYCFGRTGGDFARGNIIIAATTVGLGGASIITGAVLSGVYARRLDRLEAASDDLRLDARELANGGFALRVAF
jgi:hypothetical protein